MLSKSVSATQFKDCGSEVGIIQAFDVKDCPTIPCIFHKGNTYAMNMTFQAKAASASATVVVHGVIAGIPVPFPIPDPNACHLNCKCPINEKDVNVVQMAIDVLSTYPSISLYVKIEIISDDLKQPYSCVLFPAQIENAPRTRLVGWETGRLFEILHQKP
ncbi:unnamed protein product [Didymodactylos carnosus]|uniref:MD-2-related lipid-recognition domain-containing protein n=1 Tax=Didymodactylos carnosus TaxID=1234261 RepID=A0A813Q9D7_9BILA|nr:unnamed protein product [Didymodactylos carnosus]CAF0763701.1 unnamed protein product [Didymodactylos carnosus]CAF3520716.1 unnamed protein product [Didymodactylos carnosus]CAF3544845.1 unnamed protein product [Didymodactylos carnosus]